MAVSNATVLKTYFETGDKPTQAQFIDLIDSIFRDQVVNVHSYRASSGTTYTVLPGNSAADNTTNLVAILADLSAGCVILFPPGSYSFASAGINGSAFSLPDNCTVLAYSATLTLTGSSECGFFRVADKTKFRWYGGSLVGHNVCTSDGLSGAAIYIDLTASAAADMVEATVEDLTLSTFKGAGWLRVTNADSDNNIYNVNFNRIRCLGGSDRSPTSISTASNQIYLNTTGSGTVEDFSITNTVHEASSVKNGISLLGNINNGVVRGARIRNAGQTTGAGVAGAYGLLVYDTTSGVHLEDIHNINSYTGAYIVSASHLTIDGFYADGQDETDDSTLARAGLSINGSRVTARNITVKNCQRGLAVQPYDDGFIDISGVICEGNVIDDIKLRPSSAATHEGSRIAGVQTDGVAGAGVRLNTAGGAWHGLLLTDMYLCNTNCIIPNVKYTGLTIANSYLRPQGAGQGFAGTGGPSTPENYVIRDIILDGQDTTGSGFGLGIQSTNPGVIRNISAINWLASASNGFAFQFRTTQADLRGISFRSADQLVAATAGEDLGLDTPTWTPDVEGTYIQKLSGLSVDGSNRSHVAWQYLDGAWRTIFVSVATWA